MDRPPDLVLPRYDVTLIICRGCRRQVERPGIGNDLVGCHDRLVCLACGNRGADLLRTWRHGYLPQE